MAGRKRTKTSGTPASIREALKKATTEMLVLYVLRRKSMYTYEMMQEIDRMSEGKIPLSGHLPPAEFPLYRGRGEGGIGRQSDSDLLRHQRGRGGLPPEADRGIPQLHRRRRPDSEPRRSQASGGVFLRCWQCR